MKDPFELADDLIKKAVVDMTKPTYKKVNYAYHFGQLSGGIEMLECYLDYPEFLAREVKRLLDTKREISAQIAEQNKQNMEALK